MGDEAQKPEIGNRLGDEMIVQFLRIVVYLVASGHAAGMEMTDPLHVFADAPRDVAVHDLHVINVEQELDAR